MDNLSVTTEQNKERVLDLRRYLLLDEVLYGDRIYWEDSEPDLDDAA